MKLKVSDLHNYNLEGLIEFSKKINLERTSLEELHSAYFDSAYREGLNIEKGVVGTPQYIASYMVSEAYKLHKTKNIDLNWFDPCSGSGIFTQEILKLTSWHHDINTISDCPRITLNEISKEGVLYSCLVIRKTLASLTKVSFKEYLLSGRLQILMNDALNIFKEQTEIFDTGQAKFDIIVGNPPYVRATRLTKTYKGFLKSNFPSTYTGASDLFLYFIASALIGLNTDGILNFISPASFFKTKSARKIRETISLNANVLQLLDLDELPVFDTANLHTTIYWLGSKRGNNSLSQIPKIKYQHIRGTKELAHISNINYGYQEIDQHLASSSAWQPDLAGHNLIISNSTSTVSLKELDIRIYSGIRPSIKKAFVYHEKDIEHFSIEIRKQWFVPCIEGKDISIWNTPKTSKYLLKISKEESIIPKEIEEFLLPYKEQLKKKNNDNKWFNLRACSYYSIFDTSGIIFPDISSSSRFSMSNTNSIILDGSFYINTPDLALLAILNSRHAWSYLKAHCSSIGNVENKGRLRLKKTFLEDFPIPKKPLHRQ